MDEVQQMVALSCVVNHSLGLGNKSTWRRLGSRGLGWNILFPNVEHVL